MARFYCSNTPTSKDFDCPKCGTKIEVEISDMDLNWDDEVHGRCPNCKSGIQSDINVKIIYTPKLIENE